MDSSLRPLVLIAEDDGLVRECLKHILRDDRFEMLVSEHGRDALLYGENLKRRLDLLITDVVMPEMCGHDLAAQLRLLHPSLKVIFMTGYLPDSEHLSGLAAGLDPLLFKPFEPTELIRRVADALGLLQPGWNSHVH